ASRGSGSSANASSGSASSGGASPGSASPTSTIAGAGPGTPIATENDAEIRQRLISLGYLTEESNNAHNNRGIIFLGKGEFDRAIAEFKAAMQDNPEFAEGYVNIARAYWQKGDDASAIDNLQKAGRINPRMKEVPLMLGNVALKAGDLKAAEQHFLKALELEPNDTDTLNCLGLVYDAWGDAASTPGASAGLRDKA